MIWKLIPSQDDDRDRKMEPRFWYHWYRVLDDLPKLDHIKSLTIALGQGTSGGSADERIESRNVFRDVFRSFTMSRCFLPRRYSLSIEDLPVEMHLLQTEFLGFSELMRNIHTLKFSTSTLERIPGEPYLSEAAIGFYARFPQTCLAPASQSLRILHLSADAPWGWHPKVDLRGIYFPRVEDLMLSRFTFSHDWQLQWLLDHAGSLKHLRLRECAILDQARCTRRYLDIEGYPEGTDLLRDDNIVRGSYRYQKRWSYYFKAIGIFPHLQSFSLLAPDHVFRSTHCQEVFDEEAACARRFDRYLEYTLDCYTPLFADWPGYFTGYERLNRDKQDEYALRKLLTVIQQRNSTRT